MKPRKSDIPQNAHERVIREYSEEGALIYFRITECSLEGQIVGQRAYDRQGNLRMETPLMNGKKHGREYVWNEAGALESMEPYVAGKLHGVSKQYGRDGKILGTYRCVHGTGFDIWHQECGDGSIIIPEIHSLQDGSPHGYEWWLDVDQHSVWHERHWKQGMVHGVERMWSSQGGLQRGYPKFWISGKIVRKSAYLKLSKVDKTLPAFREKGNLPRRKFPSEIEKLLSQQGKVQTDSY
jgi:antitoxin component YwqK of YwqJK toxin-antitoxin module